MNTRRTLTWCCLQALIVVLLSTDSAASRLLRDLSAQQLPVVDSMLETYTGTLEIVSITCPNNYESSSSDGTAEVTSSEYDDGYGDGPLEPPPPEVILNDTSDETTNEQSLLREYYLVLTDSGSDVPIYKRLYFPAGTAPSDEVSTGWTITVSGRPTQDQSAPPCGLPPADSQSATASSVAILPTPTGDLPPPQHALLVDSWVPLGGPVSTAGWPPTSTETWDITSVTFILNLCNNPLTITTSAVETSWFGSNPDSSTATLQQSYAVCSYNKYTFRPENNIIIGPIDVPCSGVRADGVTPWSSTSCSTNDRYGWAEWTEAYVRTSMGMDLSQYRHGIFLFNNPTCGFTGIANAGCGSYCRVWAVSGGPASVPTINAVFHEMGHNFFLHHAQGIDGSDYSDLTCAMGGCCAVRCFNAPHTAQIGWSRMMSGGNLTVSTLAEKTWKTVTVRSQSFTNQSQNFVVVSPKTWGGSTTYYLGYKTATGYDRWLSSAWLRKLSVYTWDGTSPTSMIQTRLRALLVARGTFTDTVNRLRIRVASTGTSSSSVRVCRWAASSTATASCP